MKDINQRVKVFREEKKWETKEIEYHSWLTGLFVRAAIISAFGKNHKYPENPLDKEEPINIEEMSKDEITEIHKNALEKLDLMAKTALGIKSEKEWEEA